MKTEPLIEDAAGGVKHWAAGPSAGKCAMLSMAIVLWEALLFPAAAAPIIVTGLTGFDVGHMEIRDVNDLGQIVGDRGGQPYLFSGGIYTYLGKLGVDYPNRQTNGQVSAINNSGQIVGYSELNFINGGGFDLTRHGFLYQGGAMTSLGNPVEFRFSSRAMGINAGGQIVGRYDYGDSSNQSRAFISSGTALMDIGNLGGGTVEARAVNDSGQVVGYSTLADSKNRAFFYSGGTMTGLVVPGSHDSFANDINNGGQVVGFYYSATDFEAYGFHYSDCVFTDLGDFLPSAINEHGHIFSHLDNGIHYEGTLYNVNDLAAPLMSTGSAPGFVFLNAKDISNTFIAGIGEWFDGTNFSSRPFLLSFLPVKEFTWKGTAGTAFNDAGNWSDGVVPVAADTAQLKTSAELKHISFSNGAQVANKRLVASNGSQTEVDLNTGAWELTPGAAASDAQGQLRLEGGSLTIKDGTLDVEGLTLAGITGPATLRVSGNGALAKLKETRLGPSAEGNLEALAGGQVTINERMVQGGVTGGDGRLLVSGTGSKFTMTNTGLGNSELLAGDGGASQIAAADGGVVEAPFIRMAKAASSVSGLALSGAGSMVETPFLRIGEAGHASAAVSTGAVLKAGLLEMATVAGAEATLTIGAGGRFEPAGGNHLIGPAGRATIEVEAGGQIEGDAAILEIGSANPALASTLRATGTGASLQDLGVAVLAGGLFHLRDGAVLGSTELPANIVVDGGRAIIQDAQAHLSFPAADGRGSSGVRGVIDIMSGGKVTAENVNLFANGRLNVNGTGAELRGFNAFLLAGVLNVSNGGHIYGEVENGVVLGKIENGGGGVIEGGNGAIHADVLGADGSIIRPGDSPGVLTIDGNLTLESGALLEMEIGGTVPGSQYDQLVVTQDFSLQAGGIIRLAFINSFAPQTGQVFKLLVAGGTFTAQAEYVVTGLEPGWEFSASHDPVTGELTVLSLNDATALPPFIDTDANGLPDAWETEHFMMLGVEPDADPDSDGLANLLEYAMGSTPVAFNQGPTIEASPQGVGGLFDYVLLVDPAARGVRLVLETSRDLDGWAKQGPTIRPATTRLAPGPFGSGVTLISDNILPTDGLRQLRFRLTSPATDSPSFLRFNAQSESP